MHTSVLLRKQPEQLAAALAAPAVTHPIRTVAHVADADLELGEQRFFEDDAILADPKADEMFAEQRAEEEVAGPVREARACVEEQTGRCDIGIPEVHRLFHAGLCRLST